MKALSDLDRHQRLHAIGRLQSAHHHLKLELAGRRPYSEIDPFDNLLPAYCVTGSRADEIGVVWLDDVVTALQEGLPEQESFLDDESVPDYYDVEAAIRASANVGHRFGQLVFDDQAHVFEAGLGGYLDTLLECQRTCTPVVDVMIAAVQESGVRQYLHTISEYLPKEALPQGVAALTMTYVANSAFELLPSLYGPPDVPQI